MGQVKITLPLYLYTYTMCILLFNVINYLLADGSENMLPVREAVFVRGKRSMDDSAVVTQEQNKELYKRLTRSRHHLKQLQLKINELSEKLKKCDPKDELGEVNGKRQTLDKHKINKALPTVFIVTPTFRRFVQKAELTRISQALKGVRNLHWIVVEDSLGKTKRVEQFLKNSGFKYTHLNIRTPEVLRKRKGEFRRFKPRGVYQRNAGIQWIRDNIDPEDTPGVVYFADDDNTYDSHLFEEVSENLNKYVTSLLHSCFAHFFHSFHSFVTSFIHLCIYLLFVTDSLD